jgi:hypothetical protein
MWDQTRYAIQFFQRHLPFTEMQPADGLLSDPAAYCLAKFGHVLAVYLPQGGQVTVDLSWDRGQYSVQWYNPRQGGELVAGSVTSIDLAEASKPTLGPPPEDVGQDWVVLLRKTTPIEEDVAPPATMDVSGRRRQGADGDTNAAGPPGAVTGFTLINAESNQALAGFDPIADGAQIDLAELPTRKLNLRANVRGRAARVQFDLNGKTGYRTEGTAPFALEGDTGGRYNAWTPTPGRYRVTATPTVGNRSGQPATVTFTVVDSE